jgi:hypothetical protein
MSILCMPIIKAIDNLNSYTPSIVTLLVSCM